MKKTIKIEEGEQLYILCGGIAKYPEGDAHKLQREFSAIPISPARTSDLPCVTKSIFVACSAQSLEFKAVAI